MCFFFALEIHFNYMEIGCETSHLCDQFLLFPKTRKTVFSMSRILEELMIIELDFSDFSEFLFVY